MIRFTYIFVFVLSISQLFSQGPLIITKQDINMDNHVKIIAYPNESTYSTIQKPSFGANQIWDYSKVSLVDLFQRTVNFSPVTDPFFPVGCNSEGEYVEPIALGRGFTFYETKQLTDDKYSYIGLYYNYQPLSLVNYTGNIADSMNVPAQAEIFTNPLVIFNFPFTYGNVNKTDFNRSVNFELSISAFGLSKAPGKKTTYNKVSDSVIGWGTLRVPHTSGDGASSIPYNVLLMERKVLKVDSMFLYGQPAPEPLLSAFGIVQGDTTITVRYIYYRQDAIMPLAVFNYDDTEQLIEFVFDTDTEISTSVEFSEINPNELVVFPNPVQNNLNLKFTENAKKMIISDIFGMNLIESELHGESQNIQLKNTLSNGTYLIRLIDINGNIISKGKFLVNN